MGRSPDEFRSVTFAAWRDDPAGGRHYVTAAELLGRLASRGTGLRWKVWIDGARQVEPYAALEEAASGEGIGTRELLALLAPGEQFIDAEFAGYEGGELRLVLREFDSTGWDVGAVDASVVEEIRRCFPDAVPTPVDVLREIPWNVGEWETGP
ncbi:hypothetical protein [Kitasatospora sp. NPDC101183]|uniref:hypothetical protein n=1 Tax=Kitasatospora sp. NPDC101183 TaxID=3364100 RepID=UPI003812DAFA